MSLRYFAYCRVTCEALGVDEAEGYVARVEGVA